MKKMFSLLATSLFLAITTIMNGLSQTHLPISDINKSGNGQNFATISSSRGELTLLKVKLPPLENANFSDGKLKEFIRDVQDLELGNEAFILVKNSNDRQKYIVWIKYINPDNAIQPKEVWIGDIICHPDTNKIYLATVKSIGSHIFVDIFRVDSLDKICNYPLDLSLASYKTWPKPSKPVASIEGSLGLNFIKKGILNVNKIKLTADRDKILIHCDDRKDLVFSYDINKSKLSKIQEETDKPK